MTMILLILKIIGIILLILLGLFITVLLLVLFVPIRYRLYGRYYDEPDLTLRVSWFLHIVTFVLDVQSGQNDFYLRIFGIKKTLTQTDNKQNFEDTIEETADVGAKAAALDRTEAAEKPGAAVAEENMSGEEKKEAVSGQSFAEETDSVEKPQGFFQKWRQKIHDILEKIKHIFERMVHAIINIRSTIIRIHTLWSDEQNKEAIRFLGSSLFDLLKRIMPRKLKLNLLFSTGSPDTTGQVLGVLALFPIGYQNRWHIVPDFEADSFYAKADFDVKGRIFSYQMIRILIRILLDKNCRKLYNQINGNS